MSDKASLDERRARAVHQLRGKVEAWDWSVPNLLYAETIKRRLAAIIAEEERAKEPTQLDRIEVMLKRLLGEADL